MSHPGQIINRTTESEVAQYEIVKLGSRPGCVARAGAAGFAYAVCCQPGLSKPGDRVDCVESGIADVRFGGPVAAGDAVTSDANGLAVKATGNAALGFALHSAVAGQIGEIRVVPVAPRV